MSASTSQARQRAEAATETLRKVERMASMPGIMSIRVLEDIAALVSAFLVAEADDVVEQTVKLPEGWMDGATASVSAEDVLRAIAYEMPVTELNPDGEEQAAYSMQLAARAWFEEEQNA